MALPTSPEPWPRRLARAGWRAAVVGAAAAGLGWTLGDGPTAQAAALALGGATFTLDLAERAARTRAPDLRRDLELAATAWAASGFLLVAAVTQAAFAYARDQGQPLDVAWDAASRDLGPLFFEPAAWLGVTLVSSWVPLALLVRLAALPGGAAAALLLPFLVSLGTALSLDLRTDHRVMASIGLAAFIGPVVYGIALAATGLLQVLDRVEAHVAGRVRSPGSCDRGRS